MADTAAKYPESLAHKNTVQAIASDSEELTTEAQDEEFKPLTREEAQKIRALNPPISLCVVLAGQVGVGSLVALLAWVLSGQPLMGWSAA